MGAPAVAVAAAVLLVAGCSSDAESERTSARDGATTTDATTLRDADEKAGSRAPQSLPRRPGPLRPATYVTSTFEPTVSFSLARGWQLLSLEQPTFVTVLHGNNPAADTLLAFVQPVRVIDPRVNYTGNVPDRALLPRPDDLVGWLARHPRLAASRRKRVTIGGRPATQIDTVAKSGYRWPGCPTPCVLLFAPRSDFIVSLAEGQKARSTVLDGGPQSPIFGIVAPEQRFPELVRVGERVLSTVEFGSP